MNGVVSMEDVADAERQAGSSKYRCVILYAESDVYDIVVTDESEDQASYEFGTEDVAQEIANESTAPSGVVFSSSSSIAYILATGSKTLWIKRIFPSSGTANSREEAQIKITHKGD
jgi:hypothetical protein